MSNRQLRKDGYEAVLKNYRWSILKRRSNLTAKQTVKLRELLKYNLQTMKAYLMREDFNRFWTYTSSKVRCGKKHFETLGVAFSVVVSADEV